MATRNIVPRATGEGTIGTAAKNWLASYLGTLYASVAIYLTAAAARLGVGTSTPDQMVELQEVETLTTDPADGYAAALRLDPGYTAASAKTVTRHNYIDMQNVSVAASAVVTDAALARFDAAIGTHKAIDAGSTKSNPGTVTAWLKVNINGTIHYIPAYSSKTS